MHKTYQVIFLFNGVTSLLGWKTVLASLDYFTTAYPINNVSRLFPIPMFVAYLIVGAAYHRLQQCFSYKWMIMVGLLASNLSLLAMFLASVFLRESGIGFAACLAMCFVNGMAGNLSQLSFYAILNYLPQKVMTPFTVGASFGGLGIASVRALILSVMGPISNDEGAIAIYFGVSIASNVIDIFLNIKFFQSEIYAERVYPYERVKSNTQLSAHDLQPKELALDSYLQRLKSAHYSIYPFHLILLVNYALSIMLFPAMTLKRSYQLIGAWPITILSICYSLGDAIGKGFCHKRKRINSYSVIFVLAFRFYFIWSVVGLTFQINDPLFNNDLHAYVNILLFGMCGGLVTNGSLMLAYERVHTRETKRYGGILSGLSTQIGIVLGTLLALPIHMI